MDVKRQTCQSCRSIDVRNLIVRGDRGEQTIFVRCAHCKELVARYELKNYYHHGKGIESYLRANGRHNSESGREWMKAFEDSQQRAMMGYDEALRFLSEHQKEV
ncbi:MAG: hypothetical protein AAF539_10745 [Planctomycetota bacterium]